MPRFQNRRTPANAVTSSGPTQPHQPVGGHRRVRAARAAAAARRLRAGRPRRRPAGVGRRGDRRQRRSSRHRGTAAPASAGARQERAGPARMARHAGREPGCWCWRGPRSATPPTPRPGWRRAGRRRRRRRRGHPPAAPAGRRPRRRRSPAGSSPTTSTTRRRGRRSWSRRCSAARACCWSPTPACRRSPTPATGWWRPPSTAGVAGHRGARAVARCSPRWRCPGCRSTGSASRASCRARPASAPRGWPRWPPSRARWSSSRRRTGSPRRWPRWPTAFGADRPAAVCRELTKTYEEVRRGPLAELAAWAADGVRGEITLVVGGGAAAAAAGGTTGAGELAALVAAREAAGEPRKEAIAAVAAATGVAEAGVFDAVVAAARAADVTPDRAAGGANSAGRHAWPMPRCPTTRRSTSRRRSTTSTTRRTSGTPTRRSPATCSTRWHRQRGEDVWFLTGTDEHGEKVLRTRRGERRHARRSGPTGSSRTAWQPCWSTIDVANDDFIRTTEQRHTERVQEFLQGCTTRARSTRASTRARTACGCEEFKLPGELLDGEGEYAGQKVCADPRHARSSSFSETNYFFRLSKYADAAARALRGAPGLRRSPRVARNEVRLVRPQGLQDLSISRSTFDWGIPVPWDADAGPLRLVRRAAQLRHRGRARRHRDPDAEKFARDLAGRRAPGRQGHPALPRGDLAGDADGRRAAVAAQGLRARLAAGRRREDEQVQAHRHRAARRSPTTSAPTRSATTSCARSRSARTARSRGRT